MTSGVALLREIVDSCTESERKIAEYLILNPKTAVFCTIAELARQADTNPPAVIRLCKRAGLSGYRELQILLTRDLYATPDPEAEEPPPAFELDSSQSVEVIAKTIVSRTTDAIERVLTLLNTGSVEEAAATILAARSIAIFGVGASANVAYDLYQKLSRIGIPCSFAFDADVQISVACGLTEADAAIAISYSGKSSHTMTIAEEAKRSGARLIGITSVGQSTLSKLADIVLNVPATEPLLRTSASLSRATQLVMVDILYATVICRSIELSIPRLERSLKAVHEQDIKPSEKP
ncbi:MAG: MurR/RpiR family transcriptional regulator [Spirochaetes bacterium]|nr:MurR/RpiR family transcriptional regulator [Spirochaetota bacterium]MBU1079022.1 MurR/RpiR family transcriptional regulator [Spirochaetota bacterium]